MYLSKSCSLQAYPGRPRAIAIVVRIQAAVPHVDVSKASRALEAAEIVPGDYSHLETLQHLHPQEMRVTAAPNARQPS